MNLSPFDAQRGNDSDESEGFRFRLPHWVKHYRGKTTAVLLVASLPAPSLCISLSVSITLQLRLLKICQRSDSACLPNVCICDFMHAESVYSCQLQTCLSYFSEVMFPQHTQVRTGTASITKASCFADVYLKEYPNYYFFYMDQIGLSQPQVIKSPSVRRH